MAYCSATAILTILPGLPQTSSSGGYSSTISLINAHIVRSDSHIEAHVSERYSVPFSSTPPLIGTISEDLTAYYSFRSLFTQDNRNKTEYFEELRDSAIEALGMIREGVINLVDSSGSLISERSTTNYDVNSNTKDYQPFFDEDEPASWKIDSDKKDDIDDLR